MRNEINQNTVDKVLYLFDLVQLSDIQENDGWLCSHLIYSLQPYIPIKLMLSHC